MSLIKILCLYLQPERSTTRFVSGSAKLVKTIKTLNDMKTFVRKITALLITAIVSIGLVAAQQRGRTDSGRGSRPASSQSSATRASSSPVRQSAAPQRGSAVPQRDGRRPIQNTAPAPHRAPAHNNPPHHAPSHKPGHNAPHHNPGHHAPHYKPAPHHGPVHHTTVHRAPVRHHHHDVHRPHPAHLHYHAHPVYHRALPARCLPFYVDDVTYYYGGGKYYVYDPVYGYEVVDCPTSVFLPHLPAGARMVTYRGTLYYEYDGMWLLPVEGRYMIVDRPVSRVDISIPLPSFRFYARF